MKDYLRYIATVGAIPIAITPSLVYSNRLAQEGVHPPSKLPNHFIFVTKVCAPLDKGCQDSPQAPVACYNYLLTHWRLKVVSPVGAILQFTKG